MTIYLEDRIILDNMDDMDRHQETTLKVSCLYLYQKCVQRWGPEGGTLRTLRVPDQRLRREGHL